MDKRKKKKYEAPDLVVATFKAEVGYAVSMTSLLSTFVLGEAWTRGGDAWDGSSSGGNSLGGGWTDYNENAWH